MGYERIPDRPSVVYHYTKRENLGSIPRDGRIRRMGDTECWFCGSLEDTLTLMKQTVMVEGKPFYKLGGTLGHYPKFVLEDYVILKLTPAGRTASGSAGCRRCLPAPPRSWWTPPSSSVC